MKINSLFLILFLFVLNNVTAQTTFHYKRSIENITTDGWYAIKLPDDIFHHLNEQFSDLRIFQLHDNDTLEIPYILRIRQDIVTDNLVTLEVLNKSRKGNILYATLELKERQKINYLDLDFKQINYNAFVTLSGSNNQKDWFELATKKRILSIQNETVAYTTNTVNFPTCDYKYIQVIITSDTPLDLVHASLRNTQVVEGVNSNAPLQWKVTHDDKTKKTIVDGTLENHMPINKVDIRVDSNNDYYRHFSIAYVRDSSKTPKGYTKFYTEVYDGYLTSINTKKFEFGLITTKEIRITIDNNDNTPLNINVITAAGPQVEIVAKLAPGITYAVYGNAHVDRALYDLDHFKQSIPDSVAYLTMSEETALPKLQSQSKPFVTRKIWLWVIMGVVIVTLGFSTLRMIKNK